MTTVNHGVFFGLLRSRDGDEVCLGGARNCISWSPDVHGYLGLAASGPSASCRVSPKVPELTLTGITSITLCTSEAIQAWEAEPWG